MDENRIVAALRRRTASTARGMTLGIGDDCAIFRPSGARDELVFTTDMLIEDVHFRAATHRPAEIGWKALARGLSDIAAMGATPRFCLLSLALPEWAGSPWIQRFYGGLLKLAQLHSVTLAGGDLAHASMLLCDIIVCGSLPRGTALRRAGARPGDFIYVSGALGGAALGLESGKGAAWRRHLKPEPRIALGLYLRETLRASAAMDLSDGISLDLKRLCLESGVSAELNEPIPVFHGATLDQALHGGEDYELLFTVRPGTKVPATHAGLPLTRIGTIRAGKPGNVALFGRPLAARGYDHFRDRTGV
jgi:thiamine-monophosphate kinase